MCRFTYGKVAFAALLTLGVSIPVHAQSAAAPKRWLMGYYVGYERDLYPVNKIDWSSLTHIAVGRFVPTADGGLDKTCDWDATQCPRWAKTIAKRAHANGVSPILFLGGAGAHDAFVAGSQPGVRAKLVQSIVATMDQLGFDGVDIDWEPVTQEDRPLLFALLKDLRAARPKMTMTMPVGWVNPNLGTGDIDFVVDAARYLDQVNIMTYDMDSSDWGWTTTWHASAVKGSTPDRPSSVESSVQAFRSLGIPAAKLGIGMGFYGQCWVGGVTGPRQPVGGSQMLASDGDMSYAHIMDDYFAKTSAFYDQAAEAPYLGRATGLGPKKCTYISYENPKSITAKAKFVKANKLGGAIIWTISQGYRPKTGDNAPLKAAGAVWK